MMERGELARGNVDWQRKSREVGEPHVEHTRLVQRVRMALNLTLPTEQVSYNDEKDWITESPELRLEVYLDGEEKPRVQIPDSFFKLRVSGNGPKNFLLEGQRGNSEKKRFLPRLQAYREGLANYYEQLGVNNFRVCWLSNGAVRRDNMMGICHEGLNDGLGSNLFLFATERNPRVNMAEPERCFDISRPESLLDPIWRCGLTECQQWHSLVE